METKDTSDGERPGGDSPADKGLADNDDSPFSSTAERGGVVDKGIKRKKTGGKVNTCRGCDTMLESTDGRSHWCLKSSCRNLKKESHNRRRREKRQKQNETVLVKIKGTERPIPECNFNANFSFTEKKEEIMESGVIVLRGFLTEIEAEVLYWHSSSLQQQSEKEGSSKEISGNYSEVDITLPEKGSNRRPLSCILEKVTGFAKSCGKNLFGHDPAMGLMYINKGANCHQKQLLHAYSIFQSNVKMLICMTKMSHPTRYVPYNRLYGEPIRDPKEATMYRIADRFQEMLPVGPMLSVGRLVYSRSLPVVPSTLEMGDALLFLGDFIHGGPSNPNPTDRRMLFVNTWCNDGVKISNNNPLDRQMNIYTLMEILYENDKDSERRKKTIEALSRHLYSNSSDPSQVRFHASTLSHGNGARYRADLQSLTSEIAKKRSQKKTLRCQEIFCSEVTTLQKIFFNGELNQ
jgi:hypothetical protein